MPFDYLHVEIPAEFRNAPEKALQMYRHELKERAGMLKRLGYTREDALMRLSTNLRWDWEVNPAPDYIRELEQQLAGIVEEVYSR
ncbi:MAG: hypothetical protein FJ125_09805 [Deltaproteobacteria bacterium]|nr:hypothetical protein [Deltaproteobacteria bacterium]